MYEDVTYELLLERMLARVRASVPDLDCREGSVIYTALAPAAVELQNMYLALDNILQESFADSQSMDYLTRRAAERGLAPYPATAAVRLGVFNCPVPPGSRFYLKSLYYTVEEDRGNGNYALVCETAGKAGNMDSGPLVPVDYIDGLESALLTAVLVPGCEAEDVEDFRKRYYASLHSVAFGGNGADYRAKTNALPGVGGVKVCPAWKGGGTVKLVIIAGDYTVPTPNLLAAVQTAIDPVENGGEGVGLAPIGHIVTVDGVSAVTIDIAVDITYQAGWSWADVRPYAEATVEAYLTELCEKWADSEAIVVRVTHLEMRFLELPGVVDVSNARLNGLSYNLVLGRDEIPVRGAISG